MEILERFLGLQRLYQILGEAVHSHCNQVLGPESAQSYIESESVSIEVPVFKHAQRYF
jgi:hypothetical protein